jgi:hypothetical protein
MPMLAKALYDLRSQLSQKGIIFVYCGYVTEPVLTGVGDALKLKLMLEDTDTKTARNIFAVFVEQMQNIIRYSAEKEEHSSNGEGPARALDLRYGIMTIARSGDNYIVKTGNLVELDDVERLRGKLDLIRQANPDALKAMYKETLRAGPGDGSKGAGVGFIEIARRASKPIAYDFVEADDRHAFFALEAGL